MPLLHLLLLSTIQGLTEFLPVSSSAHLILVPHLLRIEDQGMLLDMAVHVGSLGAVMLYFRNDVLFLMGGGCDLMLRKQTEKAGFFLKIVVATLPLILAGFLLQAINIDLFRQPLLIALSTILFGLLLWMADARSKSDISLKETGYKQAFFVGCLQILALIPGTSRSGITITAARLLGLPRTEAARFSMLLSIPAILGAGVLLGWKIAQQGTFAITSDILLAIFLSFLTALVAITAMMKWLEKSGFLPFVIYRLCLGVFLLWWLFF